MCSLIPVPPRKGNKLDLSIDSVIDQLNQQSMIDTTSTSSTTCTRFVYATIALLIDQIESDPAGQTERSSGCSRQSQSIQRLKQPLDVNHLTRATHSMISLILHFHVVLDFRSALSHASVNSCFCPFHFGCGENA